MARTTRAPKGRTTRSTTPRTTRTSTRRTGARAATTPRRGTTGRAATRGARRPVVGKLASVTLHVDDFASAVDFYQNTLGLKLRHRDDDSEMAEFDTGTVPLSFHTEAEPGGREVGTPTGFVFTVRDVDEVVQELRGRGAKIVDEPEDMPWGDRIATIADPDGNTFVVSAPARET